MAKDGRHRFRESKLGVALLPRPDRLARRRDYAGNDFARPQAQADARARLDRPKGRAQVAQSHVQHVRRLHVARGGQLAAAGDAVSVDADQVDRRPLATKHGVPSVLVRLQSPDPAALAERPQVQFIASGYPSLQHRSSHNRPSTLNGEYSVNGQAKRTVGVARRHILCDLGQRLTKLVQTCSSDRRDSNHVRSGQRRLRQQFMGPPRPPAHRARHQPDRSW